MKIKVSPEGREGIWITGRVTIVEWLQKYGEDPVHCYLGGNCVSLLGANWEKESVVELILKSDRIGILTGDSLRHNRRHALSVIIGNKMYAFDIGEITGADLEIVLVEKS